MMIFIRIITDADARINDSAGEALAPAQADGTERCVLINISFYF